MMKLYGAHELARALGVDGAKLASWRRRGHVPTPEWELRCGPVWRQDVIQQWISDTREKLSKSLPIASRVSVEIDERK